MLVALAAMPPLHAAPAAPLPTIAIIDSGINKSHGEFTAGQVVAWRDFVNGNTAPYDDHWHGTAVASRAAGKTLGAAPGAPLIIAKVLNAQNVTTWGRVADAIRWATDQGAAVINVSLWSELPSPLGSLEAAGAVEYAADRGVLVVMIGGNGGRLTNGSAAVPSTFLPGASAPRALTVGAANLAGSPWHGSQADPELIAYGAGVTFAYGTGFATGNGTSFAAPAVAGVAARMIADGAPRDPEWLGWVLMHCSTDRDHYTYFDEGYGLMAAAGTTCARDVAARRRPVPGPDVRDLLHLLTTAVRVAQTGQEPGDALPPGL